MDPPTQQLATKRVSMAFGSNEFPILPPLPGPPAENEDALDQIIQSTSAGTVRASRATVHSGRSARIERSTGLDQAAVGDQSSQSHGDTTAITMGHKKERMLLVAKKLPPDYLGEEPEYTNPSRRPVPVTLVAQTLGINTSPPKPLKSKPRHAILGDIEDFEEMEEMYGGDDAENEVTDSSQAVEDPTTAEEKRREQEELAKRAEAVRQRQKLDRRRWLSKLHIFQKYREVREENALRNWRRHSIKWHTIERRLAQNSQKTPKELLMARLGEYREKVEEQQLVEEALRLLETRHVNFWSPGLRIGNDLLGLMVTMPRGGSRRIERFIKKEERHFQKDSKSNAYRKARKQELRSVISKFDPFVENETGEYMEVVGHAVNTTQLQEALLSRLQERSKFDNVGSTESLGHYKDDAEPITSVLAVPAPAPVAAESPVQEPTQTNSTGPNEEISEKIVPEEDPALAIKPGPNLFFPNSELVFEVVLDEVSTSVLSVYNRGTTAVHFEWRKLERDNPLKVKAIYDGVQRFYFHHKKGIILPGTAFDFPIIFKSASPGIFTETWALATYPKVSQDATITLQGIALEEDKVLMRKNQIEAMLERRQATTAATEVIQSILGRLDGLTQLSLLERKRKLATSDEHMFITKNSEHRIPYSPHLFSKFESLYEEIFIMLNKAKPAWDRSISSIYEAINSAETVETRSSLLARLNSLVNQSMVSTTTTAFPLLYVVSYDLLVELADKIVDTSDGLRKKMNLPLIRTAMKFPNDVEDETDDAKAKDGKAGAPPPADDKGKKGAPPAAAAKDPKGGKAAPAPPAKPAAPAAKPGKKGEVNAGDADDASQRPALAKVTRFPPKPDSSRQWSMERRLAERQYRSVFFDQVYDLVVSSVDRMCSLFDDVSNENELKPKPATESARTHSAITRANAAATPPQSATMLEVTTANATARAMTAAASAVAAKKAMQGTINASLVPRTTVAPVAPTPAPAGKKPGSGGKRQ